jgi:hypothetical protein
VAEFKKLITEHADKKIGEVTIGSVLTGMKGTVSLLTDTSNLILRKEYGSGDIQYRNCVKITQGPARR